MTDWNFEISHLARQLLGGQITSLELTEECLRRMKETNDKRVVAFIDTDGARRAALASDARRLRGEPLGVLDGIPFVAEDRFCTRGLKTENHSRMLQGYLPPYDADAVKRLKAKGAVLLGKLQTEGFLSVEFGQKKEGYPTPEHSCLCPFSLLADTGNVFLERLGVWKFAVSLTRDQISRGGMIACAPSFDRVGFGVNSSDDGEILLNIFTDGEKQRSCGENFDDAPIAVWGDGATKEQMDGEIGSEQILFSVESTKCRDMMRAYRILSAVEAASEMALYDGLRFGACAEGDGTARGRMEATRGGFFSRNEKKLILLGTALLMGEHRDGCYAAARTIRDDMKKQFRELFSRCSLLICPLWEETAYLPAFLDLSAVSKNGFLLMAPRGREELLLKWAKVFLPQKGGVRYES